MASICQVTLGKNPFNLKTLKSRQTDWDFSRTDFHIRAKGKNPLLISRIHDCKRSSISTIFISKSLTPAVSLYHEIKCKIFSTNCYYSKRILKNLNYHLQFHKPFDLIDLSCLKMEFLGR